MTFNDSVRIDAAIIGPELRKGFQLDEVIVLPNEGEVVRQGKHYHLPPTAMQILLFLCEHKGQTLTTKQLLEFGWGDTTTHRINLTHVITEIRHTLGDHKECPEFIQTFSGKGYRLIASIKALDKKVVYPKAWSEQVQPDSNNSNSEEFSNNWHWSVALLKNSKLLSVSFAFMVGTWVLLQVLDFLFPIFNIPNWWLKIVVLALVVGFPLVLLFTWLKEIKIKRFLYSKETDKNRKKFFFKQLAIDFGFIGVLSIGVGYLSFFLIESIENDQVTQTETTALETISVPIDNKLIAVLPFQFETQKVLPKYFQSTFQGELINALSRQNDFKLVSQRAINEIPLDSKLSEFVERLGARYLIDGNISGKSQEFTIRLALTDTISSLQIWSSAINGNPDNLLESQKELYRKVFNALALLAKQPNSRTKTLISTNDFKAYDSYIQGKSQLAMANTEANIRVAEGHFLQALNYDSDFTLASAGLCQSHLDIYQLTQQVSIFQAAQNSCSALLKIKDLKAEALVALGNLNNIKGEYDEANKYFSNALALNPENLGAIAGTALSEKQLGHYTVAEKLYQKAINLEPGYWKNYLNYGDFLFIQGQYQNASEQYLRVTLMKHDLDQGFNRLGASYYLNDQLEPASLAWEQSLKMKPSALNYSNLGTAQFFRMQFKEATKNYTLAINLKPADPVLWGNLGDSEQFSKNYDQAHQAYHNAYDLSLKQLQINPHDEYTQGMIARYQSELGQCKPALDTVGRLKEKELTDPYFYYDLSLISLNCNKIDQARELLSKAVSQGYSQHLLAQDIQFRDLFEQPQ